MVRTATYSRVDLTMSAFSALCFQKALAPGLTAACCWALMTATQDAWVARCRTIRSHNSAVSIVGTTNKTKNNDVLLMANAGPYPMIKSSGDAGRSQVPRASRVEYRYVDIVECVVRACRCVLRCTR